MLKSCIDDVVNVLSLSLSLNIYCYVGKKTTLAQPVFFKPAYGLKLNDTDQFSSW